MHEIFIQNKEYLISYYGYIQVSLRRYGSEVFYAFHGQMDTFKKKFTSLFNFFSWIKFYKVFIFLFSKCYHKGFFSWINSWSEI